MTQEGKLLLLQEFSTRLPYGVYIEHTTTGIRGKLTNIVFQHKYNNTDSIQDVNAWIRFFGNEYVDATYFRPYLRPMPSMSEEEIKEFRAFHCVDEWHPEFYQVMCNLPNTNNMVNWLDKKMFDHRGLIPMGLALEAPEDMYK